MFPTVASSRELAAALASRLDDVAPDGLVVRADEGMVNVLRDGVVLGGSAAPRIVDDPPETYSVEAVALSTISGVQDVIAEALTTPWPAVSGTMPNADARIEGDQLIAWFGSEEEPALVLRPWTMWQ
jgi:hypothetical protein